MAAMLRFAGHASLFDVLDLSGDVVRRGAFAGTLLRRGAEGVRMLFQHEVAEPVGVWEELREDARGLYVRGRIVAEGARGRLAARLVAERAVDGLSIGFRVVRARPGLAGARELLEIDLWEVSIVTFPLLPGARLSVLGPADRPSLRERAHSAP